MTEPQHENAASSDQAGGQKAAFREKQGASEAGEAGERMSQRVVSNQKERAAGGESKEAGSGNKPAPGVKSISSSSPEAQQAAQQVTPEKLSALLLESGPLAIRFITKALSSEIPKFVELSASKQRRLIMSALESGDEANSVVFAKIGWGQWSALKVENPEDFVKQRELTNIANAKIKDQMASERRRSSGGGVAPNVKEPLDTRSSTNPDVAVSPTSKPGFGSDTKNHVHHVPPAVGRDTASASTFLDENAIVSDDDEEDNRYYDDDEEDEEFNAFRLNQDVFRRRQSSVISDNNSPPNELELAVRSKLKNGSRSGSRSIHRQRQSQSSGKKRSSSVSKPYRSSLASLVHSNGSETLISDSSRRRMSTHPIDQHRSKSIVQLSGSETDSELMGHIASSRRESRLSFTNESSMRSTLAASLRKQSQNSLGQQENEIHSDTDEEDWQAIGAETLRNHGSSPGSASPRDQDAAIALMSLKS